MSRNVRRNVNRKVSDICLQVFARAPVIGAVKTRLVPALGAHGATALHVLLADRVLAAVADTATAARELWLAGDAAHPWAAAACARGGLTLCMQTGDDLGARMDNAAAAAAARNLMPVIVGTDCWVLDADYLRAAADALAAGADVVLGPVEDGGYVLIGLRRPAPQLFHDMTWSVPTVLAETLRRCHAAAWRVHLLPTLWDVDRPADVARLRTLCVRWDEGGS